MNDYWRDRLSTEVIILGACLLFTVVGLPGFVLGARPSDPAEREAWSAMASASFAYSIPIGFWLYGGLGFLRLLVWALMYRLNASTRDGGLLVRGAPHDAGGAVALDRRWLRHLVPIAGVIVAWYFWTGAIAALNDESARMREWGAYSSVPVSLVVWWLLGRRAKRAVTPESTPRPTPAS